MSINNDIKKVYLKIQEFDDNYLEKLLERIVQFDYLYKFEEDDDKAVIVDEFIELLNKKIIADRGNKSKSLKDLTSVGIDKLFIKKFIEFSMYLVEDIIRSKILNELSDSEFKTKCEFVLNRMVLTQDYRYKEPKELLVGLEEFQSNQGFDSIMLLIESFKDVGAREILPDSLKVRLLETTDLNDSKVQIIIKLAEDNLEKLHLSSLYYSVQKYHKCIECENNQHETQ